MMKQSKKYKETKNQSMGNLVNHAQTDQQLTSSYEESQSVDGKKLAKGQSKVQKNNLY